MVRAMLLRAAFGGMEGDIAMLHRAAATWQRRWARAEAAWADGLAVAFGGAAAAADGVMSGEAPLMVTDIPPAAVDFHCSSVLESVLEQPAVRDALLARGGGDIDGLAQRAMWKCSSGVSRKAPIRAGDHLGHWVVAGAVAEAEAAGDDDGGSGGASGSVAAAWSILREPCAAFARKLVAGKLRRGAGPAVAPLAPQLRPPPPRAATDGRVDGAAADRALLAAVGSAAGALIRPEVLPGTRAPAAHPGVARLLHRGGLCECGGGGGAPRVPRRPRVRRGVGVSGFNGPSRGKRWGVITDLRKRTVSPARVPVPPPLAALAQRMVAAAPTLIPNFKPNGCNAIDYIKAAGHEITAHCDDRQLSGDILANLSLAGDAVMTYTSDREKGYSPVKVLLPRRSLQLQTGDVRYNWQHAILNADLLAPRRVSITFRQEKLPGST